jgi:hypothetical protein
MDGREEKNERNPRNPADFFIYSSRGPHVRDNLRVRGFAGTGKDFLYPL